MKDKFNKEIQVGDSVVFCREFYGTHSLQEATVVKVKESSVVVSFDQHYQSAVDKVTGLRTAMVEVVEDSVLYSEQIMVMPLC